MCAPRARTPRCQHRRRVCRVPLTKSRCCPGPPRNPAFAPQARADQRCVHPARTPRTLLGGKLPRGGRRAWRAPTSKTHLRQAARQWATVCVLLAMGTLPATQCPLQRVRRASQDSLQQAGQTCLAKNVVSAPSPSRRLAQEPSSSACATRSGGSALPSEFLNFSASHELRLPRTCLLYTNHNRHEPKK